MQHLPSLVVHAGFQLLDWEVSGTLGIRHDVSSMAVSGKLGGLVGEIPDVTHDPRETSGQLVAGQFGPDCHRLLAENVENIVSTGGVY